MSTVMYVRRKLMIPGVCSVKRKQKLQYLVAN